MAFIDAGDVATVRSILGNQAAHLTDAEIIAPAYVLRVEQRLRRCWSAELDALTGDDLVTAHVGASYLLASELVGIAPRVSSSRFGDQQVTLESGAIVAQVAELRDRGNEMLVELMGPCALDVADPVPDAPRLFRRARGRRGA